MDDGTYEFGWRRFRLEVPVAWEPGNFRGDDASGYARLDDPLMQRLEMKWERAYRQGACDEAFDLYVEHLEKAANQKGAGLKREPKEFALLPSWPDGMNGRTLRWSGDVDCVAAFISCGVCDRLTAIQVLFPAGGLEMGVARRAIASFRDHVAGPDAPALWSLYRMRFHAPGRWRLKQHRFGPGYAEMQFAGPGGLVADFRRAGPAEVLLKKRELADWYLGQLPKGVRVDPARIEKTQVRGDTVLSASREPKGIVAALRRRGKGEAALRGMAMESVAWHCPASNRLWAVSVYARTLDAARQAEWQVFCHE